MLNLHTLALIIALSGNGIPSGNDGYNYLSPKQIHNSSQPLTTLVSGSLNGRQIQPITFQATQGNTVIFSPNKVELNNQQATIFITVYDSNGNIVDSQVGSPYAVGVGFIAPMTGQYKIEIAGDSAISYTYKLQISN